jgi:hypothetical protein
MIEEFPNLAFPDVFAECILKMQLYPRQREVLRALAQPGAAISFRSCNEGGKTKIVICAAILWHLANYPKGHVITTSGTFRQILDQLVPALHAHQSLFPKWTFLRTPRIVAESLTCFWEGYSTDEGGKFEGHHAGGPDEPLMIIVDEAKTVKDDIFEAIERCKPTRLLIASSPGYAEGEFYRSQTTKAKFYRPIIQRASECPHWTREQMDRVLEKHGENHPLYRSMVMAEFMESVANAVVELKWVEDVYANPPITRKAGRDPGQYKAFCDFAWNNGDGDENVLALRDGNVITIEKAFHAGNLDAICGGFIPEFIRLNLQPWQIDADEGGAGKLICDRLKTMGWPINRVNNGAAPKYCQHYANHAAEMWFEGAKKIAQREIILPDDNDLRAQILDRKRVPNAQGKLAIESKSDMKKRGVSSPDRADAVFGAMTPVRQLRSYNLGTHQYAGNASEDQWQNFGDDAPTKSSISGAWWG